jgi:hypothetical protein
MQILEENKKRFFQSLNMEANMSLFSPVLDLENSIRCLKDRFYFTMQLFN